MSIRCLLGRHRASCYSHEMSGRGWWTFQMHCLRCGKRWRNTYGPFGRLVRGVMR